MDIYEILLKIGLPVANAVAAIFLVPLFKRIHKRLGDSIFMKFIENSVVSAEQIYGPSTYNSSTSKMKYDHVVACIQHKFGDKVPSMIINAFIEAAVKNLKDSKREEEVQKPRHEKNISNNKTISPSVQSTSNTQSSSSSGVKLG